MAMVADDCDETSDEGKKIRAILEQVSKEPKFQIKSLRVIKQEMLLFIQKKGEYSLRTKGSIISCEYLRNFFIKYWYGKEVTENAIFCLKIECLEELDGGKNLRFRYRDIGGKLLRDVS